MNPYARAISNMRHALGVRLGIERPTEEEAAEAREEQYWAEQENNNDNEQKDDPCQ